MPGKGGWRPSVTLGVSELPKRYPEPLTSLGPGAWGLFTFIETQPMIDSDSGGIGWGPTL